MENIKKVLANLDTTKKNYAVFDCDMTLISTDVEQETLKYQIKNREFKVSEEELKDRLKDFTKFKYKIDNSLIDDYYELFELIYREYGVCISSYLLKGYSIDEVYNLCEKALENSSVKNIKRKYIEQLIALLRENNVEIYICSASMKYEVFVVADMYGIPKENVLAIDNKRDEQGNLLGIEFGVITRREGKVEAIKTLGYDYPPILVAGNSDGDYEMITQFDVDYGMIINAKEDTKVKKIVDNKKYFYHLIED